MRSRSRELQVFSVSFLDVLSCALGGVLIMLFSMSPEPVVEMPPLPVPEAEPEPIPTPPEPEPERGFLLRIAMAVRIEWDAGVDVDLWINDPDPDVQYVYWKQERSRIGFLMRDSRTSSDQPWEVYFTTDPYPGVYEIYAHFYEESSTPANVTLAAHLFPGDPDREQQIELEETFRVTRAEHGATPGLLLARLELKQVGDEYELVLLP